VFLVGELSTESRCATRLPTVHSGVRCRPQPLPLSGSRRTTVSTLSRRSVCTRAHHQVSSATAVPRFDAECRAVRRDCCRQERLYRYRCTYDATSKVTDQVMCDRPHSYFPVEGVSRSTSGICYCHDQCLAARGISAGRTEGHCRHSVAEKTRTGRRRTEELSTRLQLDIRGRKGRCIASRRLTQYTRFDATVTVRIPPPSQYRDCTTEGTVGHLCSSRQSAGCTAWITRPQRSI